MKAFLGAAALAALVLAVPACGGEPGSENHFYFADQTGIGYDARANILPIAAGATIEIKVQDFRQKAPTQLTFVSSSDPAVLAVEVFQNDLLWLQAKKTGTARITAKTATNKDSIELHVHAIASSELYVPEDISGGLAMVPGADVRFRLLHFDASGTELTGFGAVPVSATPGNAVVPEHDSNVFHLVAPSSSGTSIDLHAGKLHYSIPVVDPASVASIGLVRPLCQGDPAHHDTVLPKSLQVEFPGQPIAAVYRVAAHLAGGGYVFGSCSDLALQPDAKATDLLSLYSDGVPCSGASALGGPSRQLVVEFKKPGTGAFTVTCFGRTATYTATIQPSQP